MESKKIDGKRILIVDDEPDVLDSLTELLDICRIDTATNYEQGKELLERQEYDMVVLDIMGVDGFDLLKISNQRKIPALMLTAHALTEESLKRSAKEGAAYFVPKDKMIEIENFAADVLYAIQKQKSSWEKWFERFAGFCDKRFSGTDWRDKEKEFWQQKMKSKFRF